MKLSLLLACAALGIVGCTTERYDRHYAGGVNSPYETEYGRASSWSMSTPYLDAYNPIFPVRRQPDPSGNDIGGVAPLIDPSRQYDWYGYGRQFPPPTPMRPRDVIEFR